MHVNESMGRSAAVSRVKEVGSTLRKRNLSWRGNPLEFNTSPGRGSGTAGQLPGKIRERHADVAQLVEHHLAKVRVASSNLVVRSKWGIFPTPRSLVEWPRGEATACKAVYTGSNPVSTSKDD